MRIASTPYTTLLVCCATLLIACGDDVPATSGEDDADPGVLDVSEDTSPDLRADLVIRDTPPGCTDDDGDGYGEGCPLGPDCNDQNRAIHPSREELCDGLDNDCNELVDDGIDCPCVHGTLRTCYDGPSGTMNVGRCEAGWQVCVDDVWAECQQQLVPSDEQCDGIDNDCDGTVDDGLLNACGRCGPVDDEVCGDGLDNDCDGVIDESEAGCDCDDRTDQVCYPGPPQTLGVGICRGGRHDCEGSDWGPCEGFVIPGVEVCDGLDNDCDGLSDEGLANACGVCGEPTPREVCDGVDNDCDGFVDEGLLLLCGRCDATGLEETCGDGLDDDCDGAVDELCACEGDPGCYPGPPETRGVGECADGSRSCDPSGERWLGCVDYVLPQPEVCDGLDNDCDGFVDISPLGCNVCDRNLEECDGVDNDCDGLVDEGLRNSCGQCLADVVAETECDGLDNDCDGFVDEGLLNACGTCGESCYTELNEPREGDDIGDGGVIVGPDAPGNPTGRSGVTLSRQSFIPPFLWAANHDLDTVSRFNTETLREEGRYWVGNNPSRTGVDLDGNVWVGGRDDGRLTKILWDTSTCPDRNGNGVIDTASADNLGPLNSAADPLADECVVYSAVPNTARPSIRGSAAGPDGRIWIGYTGGGVQSIDPFTFELGPFVPETGVPLYAPDESGVQRPVLNVDGTQRTDTAGGVYGVVIDSRGFLYTSSYRRNVLARFDTNTGQWDALFTDFTCGSYGITVDGRDRIFTGGWPNCRGVGMFDPRDNRLYNFQVPSTFTPSPGATTEVDMSAGTGCSGLGCVTGVAAEPATGDVWASFYGIGYTGRLQIDESNYANSRWTMIGTTRDAAGAFLPGVGADLRGVGFDAQGFAWTLGLGSDRVWKIDPTTNARAADMPNGVSIGGGSHYTYSDFTGSTALSFTAPNTSWRFEFDSRYGNAKADFLVWEAYVPEGTTAGIRVRALDAARDPVSEWNPPPEGDGTARFEPYPTGEATSTFLLEDPAMVGQVFQVEVRMRTSDPEVQPIVHSVQLHWQRP